MSELSSSLRLNDFVAVIVRILDDDEWRGDIHERVLAPRAASLRTVQVLSEDERLLLLDVAGGKVVRVGQADERDEDEREGERAARAEEECLRERADRLGERHPVHERTDDLRAEGHKNEVA